MNWRYLGEKEEIAVTTVKRIRLLIAAAASIGIVLFAPTSAAQLNCNVGVEYYPDGGGIKRCTLNGHHTFYTAKGLKVTCADGLPLTQWPNGAVQSCSIEKTHNFDGISCDAPSRVEFEPDGRLRKCESS